MRDSTKKGSIDFTLGHKYIHKKDKRTIHKNGELFFSLKSKLHIDNFTLCEAPTLFYGFEILKKNKVIGKFNGLLSHKTG